MTTSDLRSDRGARPLPGEFLVILPHEVGIAIRYRIPVDGNTPFVGIAPGQFLGDKLFQLDQGTVNRSSHQLPVRLLRMPLDVGSDLSRAIPNLGRPGPEVGRREHLFNVAQPVGPFAECLPGQRIVRTKGSAAIGIPTLLIPEIAQGFGERAAALGPLSRGRGTFPRRLPRLRGSCVLCFAGLLST